MPSATEVEAPRSTRLASVGTRERETELCVTDFVERRDVRLGEQRGGRTDRHQLQRKTPE